MNQPITTSEPADLVTGVKDGYVGQSVIDIHRREAEHAFASERLCLTDALSGLPADGSDDSCLLTLMPVLKRLYECITSCESPPAVAVKHKRDPVYRYTNPAHRLTKIGKEVVLACRIFASQVEAGWNYQQACARRNFHPIIEVTLNAVLHWQDAICEWQDKEPFVIQYQQEQESVDALHRFVNQVRRESQSQAFKNALHDLKNKEDGNFKSACESVTELFRQYSRLLVLRVDLYIQPNAKAWGYSNEAYEAVRLYLRDLREGRIVPGHLRHIVKGEDGINRGNHFHLIVFLDGHLHQHTYHLTKLLGEAWKKRVGSDKGSYFNCYVRKDSYRYNGLGLVHVRDAEKLIGLRIALWYMTKRDTILPMMATKRRNFWGSLKTANESKRGAPRKGGDGMDLVKRILGGKRSVYPKGFEPPKKTTMRPVNALPATSSA